MDKKEIMTFDVVVIGASTSGLFAAHLLAQAGRRVAVFERQTKLNPTRRTYITTPELRRFLGEIASPVLQNHIEIISVETPGARVAIRLKEPDLVIERNFLIRLLAERLRNEGGEIFYGYLFQGFDTSTNKPALRFQTPDKHVVEVHSGAVIGADGIYSSVAEAAGISHPLSTSIVQAEIELPLDWDPAVTRVWFNTGETRFFYWLIPESEERAVIGLVGDDARETRALLDRFLAKHNFHPLAFQSGRVAMHHPRLRPWGRVGSMPVMLVGDAAGQVKVTSVGGTVTGLWAGQAAAQALLSGRSYAHELRPLKRELDLHWWIRMLLERLDNPGYDQLVNTISPAVRGFLTRRNRDQMAWVFWLLPFLEPRLLLLGLRLLLPRPLMKPSTLGNHATD